MLPNSGTHNPVTKNTGTVPKIYQLPSDPRITIGIRSTDLPANIDKTIFNFNNGNATSEEDRSSENQYPQGQNLLFHSPNSTFPLRTKFSPIKNSQMDTDPTKDNQPFITPKKFSSNFEKLIREKSKKTLTKTSNRYHVLTEDSDSEMDDEKKSGKTREDKENSKTVENKEETIESILAENKASNTKNPPRKVTTTPKNKTHMPPIIIDGKTASQNTLVNDIKAIVSGKFSIKHTNTPTILFLEEKEDHEKMVNIIKAEKLPYHTYTNREEKTHEFVLRGLADGTKIEQIDEDLAEEYDIKARSIFRMNTKNRPLFLVITDPTITLDYLNKNARRVLYTRVVWELRKSVKQIVQCHTCQQWGHATANCGRQPKCVKCAGDHHTSTCLKTRDTPATCVNCGGDHPANYTKCKSYTDRLERLELNRMQKPQKTKYVPAPVPAINQWDARRTNGRIDDFPALPNRNTRPNVRNNSTSSIPRMEGPRQMAQGSVTADVTSLNEAFAELNSLVNIGELARAVRQLNAQIRLCKTGQELIETYNHFMTNVDFNFKLRN
ncbi:unnamed protein product [Psylliodes chrysocephalus]|uniref:Gag-like protein n=1 Tax=Psylliodes chrysocephalus TaxID=3402493 RepID=A0A9P0DC91_9CUCU|nr:unnamed protein product [Psylliodes chrysocephala]